MKLKSSWVAALLLGAILTGSAQSPYFHILTPNYSEPQTNGHTIQITWTTPNDVTNVSLKLMINETEGAFIATSIPNTGSYMWVVNPMGYDPTINTNFHLRVEGCNSVGWCGNSDTYPSSGHPTFPIIVLPQTRLTSIKKIGGGNGSLTLELKVSGPAGATQYLEYSSNLTSWIRLANSAKSSPDGNVVWNVIVSDPKFFFRVATIN